MCGRYAIPAEAAVERLCAADFRKGFSWMRPLFNVAPATQVPVIVQAPDGVQEIQGARWGLIPAWWTRPEPPRQTINARAEDAAEKPVWRESLRAQRCLVPALGWYEWSSRDGAHAGDGRAVKQPHFIHRPGAEALAFAGLWARREPAAAAPLLSCAILTTRALAHLERIHPRMPVVLRPEDFAAWLDPATAPAAVQALLAAPDDRLEAYPVSPRVNSIRNDSAELLARAPLHQTGELW
jgi:putative SOS response-associated peptidase YedK